MIIKFKEFDIVRSVFKFHQLSQVHFIVFVSFFFFFPLFPLHFSSLTPFFFPFQLPPFSSLCLPVPLSLLLPPSLAVSLSLSSIQDLMQDHILHLLAKPCYVLWALNVLRYLLSHLSQFSSNLEFQASFPFPSSKCFWIISQQSMGCSYS